jgi:hypothetical protein
VYEKSGGSVNTFAPEKESIKNIVFSLVDSKMYFPSLLNFIDPHSTGLCSTVNVAKAP